MGCEKVALWVAAMVAERVVSKAVPRVRSVCASAGPKDDESAASRVVPKGDSLAGLKAGPWVAAMVVKLAAATVDLRAS